MGSARISSCRVTRLYPCCNRSNDSARSRERRPRY